MKSSGMLTSPEIHSSCPAKRLNLKPTTLFSVACILWLKWPIFFLALEESANVTESCAAAGISRQTAYENRNNSDDFAALWEDALETALDGVEQTLWTIAKDGNYKAALAILKARREAYKDNQPVVEVNTNNFTIDGVDALLAIRARADAIRERQEAHEVEGLVIEDVKVLEAGDDETGNTGTD